jgi:phosphatidylcholine synthase
MIERPPGATARADRGGVGSASADRVERPAGLLAIFATIHGDVRAAFLWMTYTLAVDAIDGTFARAVRVKEVLPFVDGSRLDDIVDYFTYVIVPAFFMVHTGLLPTSVAIPVASLVLIASGYGFSQTAAKTPTTSSLAFPRTGTSSRSTSTSSTGRRR